MRQKRHDEQGIALIMALIALLIVTSIGLSMMFMSDTETSINSNYRDEQTAYYASKAGLEEVRDRMRPSATNTINATPATSLLPTTLPGTTVNGVLYITNPLNGETVAPWLTTNTYFDDQICKQVSCGTGIQLPTLSGWYQTATASTTYATSPVLPYKWVRITLKTNGAASGWSGATQNVMYVDGQSAHASYYVCWNGTNEIAQSTPCTSPKLSVYLLTALAVTPSGTRRMLQYEMTQDMLNLTFPSALTLDGSNASLSTVTGPHSMPYKMVGTDTAGCGGVATGSPQPAIGVTNTPDIATVISGIPSNRLANYTGKSAAPDVENIASSLPANMQSVASLNALLQTVKSNANQVYSTDQSNLANVGTPTAPQIIYIDGNYSPSGNVTGYGILVVTGTFSPGGNVGWNGIVMVVGQGSMVGNGGGNNSYNGAVIVAKTADAGGNPLASLGAANFDFSGGGGNGINYSSGCINQASSFSDYLTVSMRELAY
jgi:Tfp pilus assembly protein PilX